MGSGAKRLRVQDLGLSGRDALLLLDALGGEAADLDVAAEEVRSGWGNSDRPISGKSA